MTEENRTYITHLKVTDVPWHRLTTAYGRGTEFPAHLAVLEQMGDLASVKESLYELTTNMEHQSTLWHANPLLSYIVKIVRNISLKIYWRKEAAKRSGHYTIALEEIEGYIADQKTVEDEIEARELARIIEAFLDTLTAKERVIFMRRYAYADTYADIAKRVGISEKIVSVRLTLIRQKMKQYLIEREVFV